MVSLISWLCFWRAGYNPNIPNPVFLVWLFLPFFPFSFSFFREEPLSRNLRAETRENL
jgi:hypothetical protein